MLPPESRQTLLEVVYASYYMLVASLISLINTTVGCTYVLVISECHLSACVQYTNNKDDLHGTRDDNISLRLRKP